MPTKYVPPRLFVILAREAPIGLIFRRGPNEWKQLTLWDTANDVFTPGAWFKGRIYERRSDLSPDGKLLIYQAHKNGFIQQQKGELSGWTAISKPPYLKPLTLWSSNAYYGGGSFEDNQTVLLNTYNSPLSSEYSLPDGFTIKPYPIDDTLANSDFRLYGNRLQRDGWRYIQTVREPAKITAKAIYQKAVKTVFSKVVGSICIAQAVGYDWKFSDHDSYKLIDTIAEKTAPLENVMWADFDQRGRLVLAKEGKIYSALLNNGGFTLTELVDFNNTHPDPQPAPEWAQRW